MLKLSYSLGEVELTPIGRWKKMLSFCQKNTEHAQIVNSLVAFQISEEDYPNTLLLKIRNEKQLKTADKRFNEPICV